jgi:two-component sensor histidine kinase
MSAATPPSPVNFLDGGGKMGALMRAHDWSKSLLGEPTTWPDLLKSTVATCLASRFPMVIWWGPDLIMLYNDAWQPILGDTKHPAGLGRPGRESWPETWPIVGQQFESALKGVASWSEDLLLASDRQGFMQECYFTYSHSPLRDATGDVVGVLTAVIETTPRVLSERRMRALRDLSNATLGAATEGKTAEQTCKELVRLLCSNNPDVPFVIQYLTKEGGQAHIIAWENIDIALFPSSITASDDDSWGVARVLRDRKTSVIDHSLTNSPPLPGGAWPEPTTQMVALPMTVRGRDTDLIGVLFVGVNSRLRLDGPYLDFLKLVAAQLAGSISTLQNVDEDLRSAKVKEGPINELQQAKQALEAQVHQKELLLKEVNHRVKNSLQIVSSILELQVPDVEGTEAADAMRNAIARVLAIATVHERLYRGENVTSVQLDTFLGDLCHEIARAYGCPEGIETNVDSIDLPTDMAVPLAPIVNELVTNVIKHVGPPCGIALRRNSGGSLKLIVSDQGQGPLRGHSRQGLGSRIIDAFSNQLGATIETRRDSKRYMIELTVPLSAPR